MVDTVDKVIVQYESQNFDKAAGDVKQLSGNLEGLTEVSFTTEKSTASLENRFASLERRFQTTAAQSAQYEKIQKDVNLAVANNPALQDRANEVLKAAEARYLGSGVAVKELAEAHKGLDSQGQAALHSVRSVVEQLALGIPPTQALTGQINHLTYAASGEGGLAGAFKQVGGLVGGLITPTNIAIAGIAGLTAAAVAAAVQLDKVQVSANRAIGGVGARTGTTVSDINNFVSQNSGLAGTGLSAKEARGLGEEFTATGDIVISRLHGMSDAVVGFANQTGKSVSEASKELVGFATDPRKALDDLGAVFGTFDEKTRQTVETLVLAGDKTGAFQVEIDAIAEKSKKAADNMGFFEKATRAVVNALATETSKPSGIENQLESARSKLNTAIAAAPDMLNPQEASQNIERLSREFENLQQAREKAIGQSASDNLNKLNTDASRAQEQVAAIAKSWGDVGTSTALALNALQQQVAVASAVTGQEQQAAQYANDFANATLQGKTALEAESIASAKLQVSQAAATANVERQINALEDQNKMIKAQQTGTEASAAAAIAYKNAIESGASEASAAALKSQTLANYMQQGAQAADNWRAAMLGVGSAVEIVGANLSNVLAQQQQIDNATAAYNQQLINAQGGSQFNPTVMPRTALSFTADITKTPGFGIGNLGILLGMQRDAEAGGIAALAQSAYQQGGISAAIAAVKAAPNTYGISSADAGFYKNVDAQGIVGDEKSTVSDKISSYDQLVQLQNSQTADKGAQAANLQSELAWLQTLPSSVETASKMADLTSAIEQLTSSTDSLTQSNQDLLSPYYTQDPRTSHIGFRSQGMASTGYIDIPGVPSANDNQTLTLPVASGERVFVGNGPNRGSGGASNTQTISVTNNITIQGNASKDEVLRTSYQLGQNMARQLRAASQ